jgi:cytochrome c5
MPSPSPAAVLASMFIAALALGLGGCGPGQNPAGQNPEMPHLPGDGLATGRQVWMETCRACHLLGVAGAPAVTDFAAWGPRLAKGMEALYASAIDGVKGPDGSLRSPPRGGNPRLSDEQVRLAVDYEVAAVAALRAAGGPKPN